MSSLVSDAAVGAAGTAPPLKIDPSEWSYLAEGGFHIILRYDGADPKLGGRILRIGKKSLGHTTEGGGGGGVSAPEAAPATAPPDEAGARRRFERGVLIPLLGAQYVQPGDAVMLSREDIDKIHARCVFAEHLRTSMFSVIIEAGAWHGMPLGISIGTPSPSPSLSFASRAI